MSTRNMECTGFMEWAISISCQRNVMDKDFTYILMKLFYATIIVIHKTIS